MLFFTFRGGCAEAIPSGASPERVLRKQAQLVCAFEFPDIDALLDCSRACAKAHSGGAARLFARSELYSCGGRFRLLVCPAQEPGAMKQFFCEYAQVFGGDAFAAEQTREHWQPVGEAQSFERLGGPPAEPPKPRPPKCFMPGTVFAGVDG